MNLRKTKVTNEVLFGIKTLILPFHVKTHKTLWYSREKGFQKYVINEQISQLIMYVFNEIHFPKKETYKGILGILIHVF